jgi:hypothetical protein
MPKLRKSTETEEATIVTSLRLTPRQHERLKALAARERRSVSQQLRFVIDGLTAERADPDERKGGGLMSSTAASTDALCEMVAGCDLRVGDSLEFLGKFHRITRLEGLEGALAGCLGPARMAFVEGYDGGFMTVGDEHAYRVAQRADPEREAA